MDSDKKWHRPVHKDFPIGTPYGQPGPVTQWKRGFHCGDDFRCPKGTPVEAADSGVVEFAGDGGDGFGNYIRIAHEDGTKSYYCHLDQCLVAISNLAIRGMVIASSGNSGNVEPKPTADNPDAGSHLHFEVRENGTPFKPIYEDVS